MNKPIVWTIAGSDNSGGAGVQADLRLFDRMNVQACSIITALTAQNSQQLTHIHETPIAHLEAQYASLKMEFPPRAIKLGMLSSSNIIETVCKWLHAYSGAVVADPVMQSTSGAALHTDTTENYIHAYHRLFPYISLLTPNVPEAEQLSGINIQSFLDIEKAAQYFLAQGVRNVLIKGGHFDQEGIDQCQDYWTNGIEAAWFSSPRITGKSFRGTGCWLSAAITAALALGHDVKDALVIAKMIMNECLYDGVNDDNNTAHLTLKHWPEQNWALPIVTSQPNHHATSFLPCVKPIGLYPVVDSLEWIKTLLPLGITTIQLRIKNKKGSALENEIAAAIQFARRYDAQLFINDYWELAIKHQAYGVHLGQEDLALANVQRIHAAGLRLGISTHCYFEVARAHAYRPSYLACGPIFPTQSKIMAFAPQGLANLQRWRKTLAQYPLVAIGGIHADNIQSVAATGVEGIALISEITQAKNVPEKVKQLQTWMVFA